MNLINWLKDHKFETHLAIFITIVVASIGLFYAARANMNLMIWMLLGAVSLANLIALFVS